MLVILLDTISIRQARRDSISLLTFAVDLPEIGHCVKSNAGNPHSDFCLAVLR